MPTDGSIDIFSIAVIVIALVIGALFVLSGFRTIRPNRRAVIERFGKFQRVKDGGLTWIIPFIEKMYLRNITEQMTDVEQQEIITMDRLNAKISAQVYYKVKEDPDSVKNSMYKVNNVEQQIIALARTTLRNVIGNKDFPDVNSKRADLNQEIAKSIQKEVEPWGVDIVRCELKEIDPPSNVQDAMNQISVAQSNKKSAVDFAEAVVTKATGAKNASIMEAEGIKQSTILQAQAEQEKLKLVADGQKTAQITIAEGRAEAIKKIADADAKRIEIVSESANTHFKEGAQLLKRLEVTSNALQNNTKYILSKDGINPTLVISDSKDNVITLKEEKTKDTSSSSS